MTSSPILTIGRPVGAGQPPTVEDGSRRLRRSLHAIDDIASAEHAQVAITGGTALAWELIR